MAATKILARDITVQVQDSDGSTWLDISSLTSATVSPADNEATIDRTTFDSNGVYEQVIAQRGATLKLEGTRLQDPDTGTLDVGQERCEELATQVGLDSLGKIRFSYPGDTNWTQWTATFSVGDQGGGTNDDVSWSVDVTKSGASTTVAKA